MRKRSAIRAALISAMLRPISYRTKSLLQWVGLTIIVKEATPDGKERADFILRTINSNRIPRDEELKEIASDDDAINIDRAIVK